MGMDENDDDAVFRALADATRRLIIDDLHHKDGQTLFEICVRLSQNHGAHMSRQAVTKHLEILESAGIVAIEWRGRSKVHFLNVRPVKRIGRTWLNRYLK
jgi:DNA-binding transcriptional ArsR family regulator